MKRPGLWTILTLGLMAVPFVGCSGGNNSSNPVNDTQASETVGASFVAEDVSRGAQTVWMAESGVSNDLVTIKINVKQTDDVFSGSFDFDYDPVFVSFVNWSAGNLLERNGHTPVYSVGAQTGKVVVGVSRTATAPGVDVTGALTLIHLTFRVRRTGSSAAGFSNASLLASDGSQPTPISGLTWLRGTFVAN